MKHYDCIIIGAGSVGSSLALSLAKLKFHVLLVDKQPLPDINDHSKTIALSYASFCIYSELGVWSKFQAPIPIKEVLVTARGAMGSSRLNADDQPLGFVVSQTTIEHSLAQALKDYDNVTILRPAQLEQYHYDGLWRLHIQDQARSCNLLVSAEGGHSILRDANFIRVQTKDYNHDAIICNVEMDLKHDNKAYERFLSQGAMALLPWQNNELIFVWTVMRDETQSILALTDAGFIARVQLQLGTRFGRIIKASSRKSFRLQQQVATNQTGPRFLLLGNAAHFLHPVAAQGLNLSLRDVWQLRNQVLKSQASTIDLGAPNFLEEYLGSRIGDQTRMIALTDFLADWASGNKLPTVFKGMGLSLFDVLKPLKNQFTNFGMGLM